MPGKTTTVANAAQFLAATRLAKGGDTILLAPGDYGALRLSGFNPVGTVTIKSADAANHASAYSVVFTGSRNIVFQDIDIKHPLKPGDPLSTTAFFVDKSSNIAIVGMHMTGSLNGNSFDDGNGLVVHATQGFSLLDSTFNQLKTAVSLSSSTDIIIAGNEVTGSREGVNTAGVTRALYEYNYLHDMQGDYAAGDHPGNFQVQNGVTEASHDLTYRNNILVQGTGGIIGGIFIRSENIDTRGPNTNIRIENNYYQGTFGHGISVSDTVGVIIKGNTVINSDKSGVDTAIRIANDKNVVIADNIGQAFIEHPQKPSSNVSYSNNIDVWEAKAKVGVDVNTLLARQTGAINFDLLAPIAGSSAAQHGVGFRPVANIGHIAGTSDALLAQYAPIMDHLHSGTLYG